MEHIVFLEGGVGTDYVDLFNHLSKYYKVSLIDNLYLEPRKLNKLKEINPDTIFVATTNVYADKVSLLKDYFLTLNWIPNNVIFFDENTAFTYLKLSRQLKERGTKFYWSPYPIGVPFWDEIDWL